MINKKKKTLVSLRLYRNPIDMFFLVKTLLTCWLGIPVTPTLLYLTVSKHLQYTSDHIYLFITCVYSV